MKPEEYLERSKQGERCAVIGCLDEPSETCPSCGTHYCKHHIKSHLHLDKVNA